MRAEQTKKVGRSLLAHLLVAIPRPSVLSYLFNNQERNNASKEAEALLQVLGVVVAMGVIAPMAVAVVMPVAMI